MLFFDEGRFGLRSTVSRIWAEKGKVTTVKVKQGFKNFYMYSSIDPKTGEDYSLILSCVDTEMMSLYLKKLSAAYKKENIVLVMDQAGWHKSKALIIPKNIQIIYLPPYSPELNPVERFWRFLKKEVLHNFIYESLDELANRLFEFYKTIDKNDVLRLCNCSYI